jgi:tetratricopeptide (TPR) repeat protein
VVVQYVALRRFGEAQSVASRASELFPTSPEPARLLSIVYAESGKWDAARQAALRWHEKAGDHPIGADVMIARTCLQQPNPDPELAIKQLSPYFDKPSATPDPTVASVYGQALIMAGRTDDAVSLLRPLAQKDSMWRLVWLDLATVHKDLAAASEWIKQVVPLVPTDLTADQLAIAEAWRRVGEHFDAPTAFQQARDVLAPLRTREPGAANAWQLWAVVSQEMNDLPEAEKGYREALQRGSRPDLQNNLAYVLLAEGGPEKLAEAEKLTTDAIAAAPNQSTFYDTLARIYAQTGRRDDAMKTFHDALSKDPNNVEAMIGLADVLRSFASGRNEAKQLFGQANSLIQSGVPLPPPLRQQFERVKTAVSSSL